MLTIGEYSRLTQVPSKTLRYYDEIGLFMPMEVDAETGYRYYSMKQLPQLYRVLSLKELGLSLKQIRDVLNENISAEELRGMLRLKEVQLEALIEAEQQRLIFVRNKVKQLEANEVLGRYDVILKEVPEMQIAMMRETIAAKMHLKESLAFMFNTIQHFLRERKLSPAGHGFNIYFDEEYRETEMDVGAAFPIHANVDGTQDVTITTLHPATMASVIHRGRLEELEYAYVSMLSWIEKNNYHIVGASREIALHYDPTGKPEDFVTELQFPVQKAHLEINNGT